MARTAERYDVSWKTAKKRANCYQARSGRRAPWRGSTTSRSRPWNASNGNNRRLFEAIDDIPPAEAETNPVVSSPRRHQRQRLGPSGIWGA